jgi:imidazolonepropionase-like amidohydrolase
MQRVNKMSFELKVGRLVIGDGRALEDANVGIEGGVVKEVATGKLEGHYEEAVDLTDRFVMPGLIDAHVHIRYGPKQDQTEPSDEYQAIRGLENARKALMAGVTSLADAGAIGNIAFAVRNAINDGVAYGPRLFVSGEMITMTGGRSRKPGARLEVAGPDSARKAARALLMYHGADFLKLGATGALSSPHTGPRHPQLTVEEMAAVVDEAHKCAKRVHAHCYGERGITNAIEAGVDVIVHGQTLTEEHIKTMKDRGMILLPTLKTFCGHQEHLEEGGVHSRVFTTGIWEETEPNFRNALEKGVTIAMGTDAGMPDNLFGENPRDLEYMVEWGMTPGQAVVAGTINAAKSIAVDDRLGTVEPGKHADLLVLKKDPLGDISAIRTSLEGIMLGGRFLD